MIQILFFALSLSCDLVELDQRTREYACIAAASRPGEPVIASYTPPPAMKARHFLPRLRVLDERPDVVAEDDFEHE